MRQTPHRPVSPRAIVVLCTGLLVLGLGPTAAWGASSIPGRPAHMRAPSQKRGAWVAKILRATSARPRPGSSRPGWHLATTAAAGYYPQELLVLARRTLPDGEDWLKVRLSKRPNDASGWIPADAARLRRTTWWVRVRTSSHTISVYHGGRLRWTSRAVVGKRSTPTPRGLFAVMFVARQQDPHGFLGPWALHLTAHSNVLDNYGGGPGRVAIHGRGGASLQDPLGSARSHGCVRVSNHLVRELAHALRPGTPVRITR